MNEDVFNTSLRGFLKKVGITSQREIEKAVRDALASGRLKGNEKLPAKMVLTHGRRQPDPRDHRRDRIGLAKPHPSFPSPLVAHAKPSTSSPDSDPGGRAHGKSQGHRRAAGILPCHAGTWLGGVAMTKKSRTVVVNDRMQRGYVYALAAPVGRNFNSEFDPELTPRQMLALGVFGGKYMTDCRGEFPASWFADARLSPARRDGSLNYFGVDASQPLSAWRRRDGSIPMTPADGFSGIAATIWAAACRQRISGRSRAGRPCGGTLPRSSDIVNRATCCVENGSGRLFCIGHTIAAGFEGGDTRRKVPEPGSARSCPS